MIDDHEIVESMVEAYDDAYDAEYLSHGVRGNNQVAMRAAFAIANRAIRDQCGEELMAMAETRKPSPMTDEDNPFEVGQPVIATGRDYTFEGRIACVFRKFDQDGLQLGPLRYVVQDSRGLLLIHSPRTLKVRQ